jgi:hypothetical protein
MKIQYTPQFLRSFNRLTIDIQEIYRNKEKIFVDDPFDKRLKTHKLRARDEVNSRSL